MVGGIAGAYRGIDSFPEEVIRTVENESELDFENIADKLIDYIRR
jgi:ADP-ribosylglycohydrolase